MTTKEEFEQTVKRDVQARVREGIKAVLQEEVLQEEEMTEQHLEAGYTGSSPRPGVGSATATTPETSSPRRAR